jgi:hypothetical protein
MKLMMGTKNRRQKRKEKYIKANKGREGGGDPSSPKKLAGEEKLKRCHFFSLDFLKNNIYLGLQEH